MVNDLILNTLNDYSLQINKMKTFTSLFFESNAFFINGGLLEKNWTSKQTRLLKKFKNTY